MRYFFHIGYRGSHYKGWQRHPYGLSVQEVIERCLFSILKTPVTITGCGRTDAGVHASQFFFHVDVAEPWAFDMKFRLNKVLPEDIAVFDILLMDGLPHARFDATKRSYDYFIHTYKDPFLSNYSSLYLLQSPNLDAMQKATALLTRYTDYRKLCLTPADQESTICHITEAQWFTDSKEGRLCFSVYANRYLSRMIRIIVGQLLKVGTGSLTIAEFESYLRCETTPKHLSPAYPQGLYLSKVTYPFLDLPARSAFTTIAHDQSIWLKV